MPSQSKSVSDQNVQSWENHQSEFEFPPGTLLRAAGQIFKILDGSTQDALTIQDVNTKDVRGATPSFLREAIAQGSIMIMSEQDSLPEVYLQFRMPGEYDEWIDQIPVSVRSEAAIAVMLTKHRWFKKLQGHNVRNFRPSQELAMKIREVEQTSGEPCPYGMDALYKTARSLRKNNGQVKALLPRFDRRGGFGGRRLDEEVELIVQKVLVSMEEKNSEKLQASRAHAAVLTAVNNSNIGRDSQQKLMAPSLPTMGRRFKEHFGAYEIARRNVGKARADLLFRENGYRIGAERALDGVQYDDTDTCVFAIDDRTGLPWGRCWATFGVDEATSSVTGLSLSENSRSTVSAHEAVMHSLMPKDHGSPDFELCAGKWYAYGNQGLIVLDNASYNASFDFQASLVDLGIEFEFARPHQPTNKTKIEHFNHRVKSEFSIHLPGWSGPKEDRELLDIGIGTAVLTLGDFRKMLFRWIVDDYSNKPLERGKTPRELWSETFALHQPFQPQRMPSDELLGTIASTLKFRDSGGLLRKLLRYQSDSLEVMRRHLGRRAEVNIRYRPYVLDYIYVQDPSTKNYLKVPCIEDPRAYRGVTDHQLKLINSRARSMFGKTPSLDQMMVAREALAADTKRLMHSKKMIDRKRALRQAGMELDAEQPAGNGSTKTTPKMESVILSELEDLVNRIGEDYPEPEPEMHVFGVDD